MIAALFLLAVPQDVSPAEEAPIVVMARKLNNWRGYFNIHDGKTSCVTKKSTGDKAIDGVGCAALMLCVDRNQQAIMAAADKKIGAETRKQMQTAASESLVECLNAERPRLIAELADSRANAQQGAAQ